MRVWPAVVVFSLLGAGQRAGADQAPESAALPQAVHFSRHVVAVFSRLGCNGGACHGAVQGQNGFRLSLFGARPEQDYEQIVLQHGGRRVKRHGGEAYVFAVCMRDGATTASLQIAGLDGRTTAEVLGEERSLPLRDGTMRDEFQPWGVHLYRIR